VRNEKVLLVNIKIVRQLIIRQDLQDEQDFFAFPEERQKVSPLYEGETGNKRGRNIIHFSLFLPRKRDCPFALSSGKSENKIRKILLILSKKIVNVAPFMGLPNTTCSAGGAE